MNFYLAREWLKNPEALHAGEFITSDKREYGEWVWNWWYFQPKNS